MRKRAGGGIKNEEEGRRRMKKKRGGGESKCAIDCFITVLKMRIVKWIVVSLMRMRMKEGR
jgi:hypothetical protein